MIHVIKVISDILEHTRYTYAKHEYTVFRKLNCLFKVTSSVL